MFLVFLNYIKELFFILQVRAKKSWKKYIEFGEKSHFLFSLLLGLDLNPDPDPELTLIWIRVTLNTRKCIKCTTHFLLGSSYEV